MTFGGWVMVVVVRRIFRPIKIVEKRRTPDMSNYISYYTRVTGPLFLFFLRSKKMSNILWFYMPIVPWATRKGGGLRVLCQYGYLLARTPNKRYRTTSCDGIVDYIHILVIIAIAFIIIIMRNVNCSLAPLLLHYTLSVCVCVYILRTRAVLVIVMTSSGRVAGPYGVRFRPVAVHRVGHDLGTEVYVRWPMAAAKSLPVVWSQWPSLKRDHVCPRAVTKHSPPLLSSPSANKIRNNNNDYYAAKEYKLNSLYPTRHTTDVILR